MDIIRRLTTERGIGILLVDHKLDEVFAIADHIVGLANGQIVLSEDAQSVDRLAVIDAIVGDHGSIDASLVSHAQISVADLEVIDDASRAEKFGDVVLDVHGLTGNGLTGVDLQVHAGEILGIYGLIGSGRSRFLRTVYGAEPLGGGTMTLGGESYTPKRPGQAISHGVAFLSEERKSDGFIPQMSSVENVVLPVVGKYLRAGILNWRALRGSADDVLARVTIRGDVRNPITSLSGGNQQKALFARATLQAPRLLLLDEPTKGVDIGAKREIYAIIRALAAEKGAAVIVVSSEEEELTGLADTITVFRGGGSDGTAFPRHGITAAQLRELAWADAGQHADSGRTGTH